MRVSVVIPVYNAAPFIVRAVESARACPEVKEIILIEDYSEDDSYDICKRLDQAYPEINLLRTPSGSNKGASVARNIGILHAKMEFLAFLDADDYYLPFRFENDASIFSANANAGGVYHAIGVDFHDEESKRKYRNCLKKDITTLEGVNRPEYLFNYLINCYNKKCEEVSGNIHLNGLTLKTACVREVNIKFNSNLYFHEDTEFIIRVSHYCKLYSGSVTEPVAMRGVHTGNRITEHIRDKSSFNKSQNLLWASIYKWSLDQNLSLEQMSCIYARYLLGRLVTFGKLKAFMMLPVYVFLSKGKILFRHYTSIHQSLLGSGDASRFALNLIRNIYRILKSYQLFKHRLK